MARFINPAPAFRPNSKLFFFESGTNTQLVTYKDQIETIPNTHPVLTDSAGVVPNIFFSGSAKLVLQDENSVQYGEYDPIGAEIGLGNFELWSEEVTYSMDDIAKGSDGEFYKSLVNGNAGSDPTLNPGTNAFWEHWPVNGIYNTTITYVTGEVTQTSNGNLWRSVSAINLNNNPETDDGTNWVTAGDDNTDRPNNQTGTGYTLVITDKSKTVWMKNAAANVLTIPPNASVAFPVNTTLIVMMEGLGLTSITAASGVTLNGVVAGSGFIDGQYSGATLVQRAINDWIVAGGIRPVS